MHIDVWADIACPWCYLGIRHLRTALASFAHRDEVEVAWHAYFLDPQLDARFEGTRGEFLASVSRLTADEIDENHRRIHDLGRAEGVVFDFDSVVVAPTASAHRVIAAAHDLDVEAGRTTGPDTLQLRMAEAMGRSHFEMGLDVSDPDVLIGVGHDLGVDPHRVMDALVDEQWASQVFSDYQIGVQMGIDLVPTYLIDRAYVVQDHQTVTAMGNILATAWDQSREERP
ncbi:DsbA family protein [Actinomyces sp. B33]|uniref:DsbA family oxidoreductase n=1 Tax=Actinomyces sp. B33 TaxID=2942131 RepID=UPI002341D104|nr:DsbA family protein [Actinomyces sp. B33]MDC4233364.1 DsbA family protein [Actinomyces sp. B33]